MAWRRMYAAVRSKPPCKVWAHKGACREKLYPSTKANCDRPFPNARQGGKILLADAAQFKMGDHLRCANLSDMLLALADGRPVIFR